MRTYTAAFTHQNLTHKALNLSEADNQARRSREI
jgi:hypothetical protein